MTTLIFTHPACLGHDTGAGHPESADRLRAVLAALHELPSPPLEWREAAAVSRDQLLRVHTPAHVDRVLAAVPGAGHRALDADTVLSPGSGAAALHAAGAVVAACEAVAAAEAANAFCAVRPPGHHAEPGRAMGFCLFNNVAVAVRHLLDALGLERVAIVDFDVHHGNGTQAAFAAEPRVFFASTHQWPLYPGTGARGETGVGNIVNVPLPPGADGEAFRAAVEAAILPALDAFAPEFILVSAGFDAHRRDPLGGLGLDLADYEWVSGALKAVAARCARGRIVSVLEGGYDLAALAASAAGHVRVLAQE